MLEWAREKPKKANTQAGMHESEVKHAGCHEGRLVEGCLVPRGLPCTARSVEDETPNALGGGDFEV